MSVDPMAVFWGLATVGIYAGSRLAYRHRPRWWTSPLLMTWALCLALAVTLHTTYSEYLKGTHWLVVLLGPATVAFAVPIYEQRETIRRNWGVLAIGVAVGSIIAVGSAWILAGWLGLSDEVRLSLLPRSFSTPFAIVVSDDLGGIPGLTATYVVITGLCGAAIGDALQRWLPLRSSFSRGALLGMGAHGCGVAKAREVGTEEGSIAGLVMMLAGLSSVAFGPILAVCMN